MEKITPAQAALKLGKKRVLSLEFRGGPLRFGKLIGITKDGISYKRTPEGERHIPLDGKDVLRSDGSAVSIWRGKEKRWQIKPTPRE